MDKKHKTIKRVLQIVGVVCAAAGLGLIIAGFVDFSKSFERSGPPQLFYLFFIGFPVMFVGITCLTFGFRKEISRYVKNESVPVLNEASEELKPVMRAMGQAVKEGYSDSIVCKECGERNDADNKFCKACGKPLTKLCAACGTGNDQDSKFCKNCGKPL